MRDVMPSTGMLEALDAVARLRSFTFAGIELGLTQAAVSSRVKALEALIGVQLISRTSRSVEMTAAGEAYLTRVREVMSKLREAAHSARGEDRGYVKILVAQAFATLWLISRLGRFRQDFPEIDLKVVSWTGGAWSLNADAFTRHDVDATIIYGAAPVSTRGILCFPLFEDSAVAVCHPKFVSGDKPLSKPQDLKHHTSLHATNWNGIWDRWLASAGVPGLRFSSELYFQDTAQSVQAATKGLGISIAHEPLVREEIAAGQLCMLFDIRLPMTDRYYLVYPEISPNSTAMQKFRLWMSAESSR